MALASDTAGTARHPWVEVFSADPTKAYDRFIRGYAEVSPYQRAEVPDAARMMFGPLAADDPARTQLGVAITAWLDARRREAIPVDQRRRGRLIREVSESFEIIRALEPGTAAQWVHDNRIRLLDWTSRLAESSARDARAAFLLTLAVTQDVVDGDDLTRLWIDLCREAGGSLPSEYLDLGLMGLRRLPKMTHQTAEAPWLAGLAQWAIARGASEKQFAAVWFPLKRIYPRQPGLWRKEIAALLRTKQYREADVEPPAWWACDREMAVMNKPNAQLPDGYRSPMPDDCGALIERLQNTSYQEVKQAIEDLMQAHIRFARATGNSRHLVAAAHQLGTALLATRVQVACVRAEDLARTALHWQPFDPSSWALWAEALEVRGSVDASEIVRRELVRRLPFNIDARTQLAEMLIALDRCAEARIVIDQCFGAGLVNEVVYALRIRLIAHLDGIMAARDVATVAVGKFSSDSVLAFYKDQLDHEVKPSLIAARYRENPPVQESDAISVSADVEGGSVVRLRELASARALGERLMSDHGDAVIAEVREFLAEEPDFAYAQLLAVRAGIWEGEATEFASVPAAFESALEQKDAQVFARLAERAPKREALTLVARALFGDYEAQVRVANWLADSAQDEPSPIADMRPRLRVILGGATDAKAVAAGLSAKREKVLSMLRLVNEALIESGLMAA